MHHSSDKVMTYSVKVHLALQVAIAWASSCTPQEAVTILGRLGLLEPAIDAALNANNFQYAFSVAASAVPALVPEVHLRHAIFLEDAGGLHAACCLPFFTPATTRFLGGLSCSSFQLVSNEVSCQQSAELIVTLTRALQGCRAGVSAGRPAKRGH